MKTFFPIVITLIGSILILYFSVKLIFNLQECANTCLDNIFVQCTEREVTCVRETYTVRLK